MLSKNKNWKSWLYILPSLGGTIVFVGLPFLDTIRRSFLKVATNNFAGLDNYMIILHNQAFQLALKNNLLLLIIGIPLLMVNSFFTALLIQSSGTKSNLYKTTTVLPMAIPVASICLLWKFFFIGLMVKQHLVFYCLLLSGKISDTICCYG